MYRDPSGNVAIPIPIPIPIPFPWVPDPDMTKDGFDALKLILKSFLKLFGLELEEGSKVSTANPPNHAPHPTPMPSQARSQTTTSTPASPDPGNRNDKNKDISKPKQQLKKLRKNYMYGCR